MSRLSKVSDACIIGAGGEMSDFQAILHMLEEEMQVGSDYLDAIKKTGMVVNRG